MPNLDGGHYFLTVLAPVRTDTMVDPIVGRSRSHRHQLAQKLSLMATGRQTAKSPSDAWPSPLSRNTLNHLARFVLVDSPAFNGRVSQNSIWNLVRNINPLQAQPVDRLSSPFLVFAADIDAQTGDDPLRAYAHELWRTMQADLEIIFSHCVGFEGKVKTAEDFHAYLQRCQVETTMPFNDYWADGLKATDTPLPLTLVKWVALAAGLAAAVWLAALLLGAVLALFGVRIAAVSAVTGWGVLVVPLLVGFVALLVWGLYRTVMRQGLEPFPTAPGSDLPTVLKALFLQQNFTAFAIEAQGLDDAALHQRFGAFVDAVQPAAATPSQPPGEVSAPAVEWAR